MRLTTWNCNRGEPARKIAAVMPLRPDVLVVQECGQLDLPGDCYYWHGDYAKQGVLIRTFGSYQLAPISVRDNVPPYVLPIQINGPETLLLFAVWTKGTLGQEYVRGLITAIEIYSDLVVSQPSIVVGDYNSNAIWDSDHPQMRNHSALVQRLETLGLESSYHVHFGENHGAETRPTYYHHWDETKPFHIDYCFAPRGWRNRIQRVEVGRYGEWSTLSDHVPLTVEFGGERGSIGENIRAENPGGP